MRRASVIQKTAAERPAGSPAAVAIETALTDEVLNEAAAFWDGRLDQLRLIGAVQNFVFELARPEEVVVLRLTHQSNRTLLEIAAELAWLDDLRRRDIAVAVPLLSRNGKSLERISTAAGDFGVTCFAKAPGELPDPKDPRQWNAGLFERWGALMGKLHVAARDYCIPEGAPRRAEWPEEEIVRNCRSYLPSSERNAVRAFDRLFAELDTLPRTRENYGLVHADLHHGNFFVDGVTLTAFDFDDSGYHWFAHDLAIAIYHLPKEGDEGIAGEAERFIKPFLRGYESVARLDRAWLERLPLFLKWRDVILFAYYHKRLDLLALPERLQRRFAALRNRIEDDRPIVNTSGLIA